MPKPRSYVTVHITIMSTQYLPTGRSASEIAADVETAVRDGRLQPGCGAAAGAHPGDRARAEPGHDRVRLPGAAAERDRTRAPAGWDPDHRLTAYGAEAAARCPGWSAQPHQRVAGPGPAAGLCPRIRRDTGNPVSPRLYGDSPVAPRLAELAAGRLDADGIDPRQSRGGERRPRRRRANHRRVVAARAIGWRSRIPAIRRCLTCSRQWTLTPSPSASTSTAFGQRPWLARSTRVVRRRVRPAGPEPDRCGMGLAGGPMRSTAVLASAPELLVIEDDHAAEVAGAPARTVTSGRQKWAVIRSVSKSLGPDLRLAIMAGDPVTVARGGRPAGTRTGWVSYLLQETVAELWQDPAVEPAARAGRR